MQMSPLANPDLRESLSALLGRVRVEGEVVYRGECKLCVYRELQHTGEGQGTLPPGVHCSIKQHDGAGRKQMLLQNTL